MIYDQLFESFGVFDWFNEIEQVGRQDETRVIRLKSDVDTFTLVANDDLNEFLIYGKPDRMVYRGDNWEDLVRYVKDNFRDDWI